MSIVLPSVIIVAQELQNDTVRPKQGWAHASLEKYRHGARQPVQRGVWLEASL
jgi:hypothetical protein